MLPNTAPSFKTMPKSKEQKPNSRQKARIVISKDLNIVSAPVIVFIYFGQRVRRHSTRYTEKKSL